MVHGLVLDVGFCIHQRETFINQNTAATMYGRGRVTRRTSRVFLPHFFEFHVTKVASHKALKLIARGKLTFDEMVVVLSVDHHYCRGTSLIRKRNLLRPYRSLCLGS